MAGVLGVATAAYLPYCFFNLLSPLISLLYGFTGFRIEHIPPTETPGEGSTTIPDVAMEGGQA
jgi:NhaC family Na+:H+ antiporter